MPAAKPATPAPFWRTKRMSEMTKAEWESLCDGCGRCCLNKLIDEDTNETVYTDVGCKLLDAHACRCTDYAHRQARVKDCVRLTWRNVGRLTWLPPTCSYRTPCSHIGLISPRAGTPTAPRSPSGLISDPRPTKS